MAAIEILRLTDNRFGDPSNRGLGKDISTHSDAIRALLGKHDGKTLDQWVELGVTVLPNLTLDGETRGDESHKLEVFTLGSTTRERSGKLWINTHNCMGVVRLRDEESGASVQIEIGSRFDEGHKQQYFLTYLLSKVFGGSFVGPVEMGDDSLWDVLLAFVFRRRLLEASAIGLFKQYRTFHHNDIRIRGRIDANEHLRRNTPFLGNVAYATHEIAFDNPTNHLIRHALAKVGRKWGGLLTSDNRITETRHQLEQNTPTWQTGKVMECIRRKENRTPIKHPYFHARYEPLRQVSLALLREEGAGLYEQQQEAEGVIFDGSWLWEEYLWTLLKPLGFEHPENKKLANGWSTPPGVTYYPDFFHRDRRVILDGKYKFGTVSQDDAKQVFAYMFLLDAEHGGLIKPDGTREVPTIIKRQSRHAKEAWWHNLVLSPPPPASTASDFNSAMEQQEKHFQENVRSMIRGENAR